MVCVAIPALGRLKEESEFKISLGYIARPKERKGERQREGEIEREQEKERERLREKEMGRGRDRN